MGSNFIKIFDHRFRKDTIMEYSFDLEKQILYIKVSNGYTSEIIKFDVTNQNDLLSEVSYLDSSFL